MKKQAILTFDPDLHRYTLNRFPVPSVTHILTDVLGEPYSMPDKEWYLQRGRAAHEAYAQLAQGQDIAPDPVLNQYLHGYVKGWRKWQAETCPVFQAVELSVGSMIYQYAGRLDAITLQGVIDYKSTGSLRTAIQLAAYALAYKEMTGTWITHGQEVEIRDDGTYSVKTHDLRRYTNEWRAILSVYNVRRRLGA